MSSARCRRRYCAELLTLRTDGMGRVVERCAACDRNHRGLCRDCPGRLASRKHLRCPECSAARNHRRRLRADRERYAREREKRRAAARFYYHRHRDRLLAELREKRKGGVRDDLDRLYFRIKSREYRARNRDKLLQKAHRYYWRNRNSVLARNGARRRTPEYRAKARAYQQERRDLLRRLTTPTPGRCVVCEAAIPYQGKGPRRIYCADHRRHKYLRYRERLNARRERARAPA